MDKKKKKELGMWESFKEGFKPTAERVKDRANKEYSKDHDRHVANYGEGGLAKKNLRRQALRKLAKRYSK